jgi:type I restriction enzyme, S subunit
MASEWRQTTLGELTDNFDSVRVPVKEADRRAGPYPYYGASAIVDYVDGYLFDGDYLLIAEDGENLRTRKTPVAFLARGRFWVNNHAHVVRAKSRADTRYLMYALAYADLTGYLSGSTLPKLTQGSLNRIPLLAPPVADQRAIAHILGTLDDKIELNRRTNETLEAIARALFKSWFVDFDPVRAKAEGRDPGLPPRIADLFPDSFEDSELGEIPRGWRVAPISQLAAVVGGGTPSTKKATFWVDGRYCWATPKDLSALATPVLLETERTITEAGLAQIGSGLLPQGTVLLSSRAPIGYLAIAEVPLAINQGFIAMRPAPGVSSLFLLYWAEWASDEIVSRANGSTFLEISKSNFRPIPVVVAPKQVFDSFEGVARPAYSCIVANERETRTLTSLRDTLLPKLISGELRVRDANRIAAGGGM